MFDLAKATRADFEPLVGETFMLHDGGRDFPFTLTEVRDLGEPMVAGCRNPFVLTLRFREALRVPQRIHRWSHPKLGDLEIFVVQTSPTDLEALFS